MSVSVVIPTKDRLRSLQRVLPTYLAEPEVDEVIVVVDGSTDGTAEYLSRAAAAEGRLQFIDNRANRGVPFSKNAGIRAASSAYVFTGEDDVELTPGFFATLLDHLRASGGDVIAGRNVWRNEGESADAALRRCDRLPGPAIDRAHVLIDMSVRLPDDVRQPLISSPMLAPRAVFEAVHFDERYKANAWREETDFQVAAQEAGFVLVSCPHAVCFNTKIPNDRGGVYGTVGLRRLWWVTVNNWRFVDEHRSFLDREFGLRSPVRHVAATSALVAWTELVLPALVRARRRLALPSPGSLRLARPDRVQGAGRRR